MEALARSRPAGAAAAPAAARCTRSRLCGVTRGVPAAALLLLPSVGVESRRTPGVRDRYGGACAGRTRQPTPCCASAANGASQNGTDGSTSGTHVAIYDTTCRDGAQMVGISLTVPDKVKIANILAEVGVAYIEGGWPGSNPKDAEFFRRAAADPGSGGYRGGPRVTAFGSTRRKDASCDSDDQVAALVASQAPVVCLVAKAWGEQVTRVLRASLEDNLRMITDTCSHLAHLHGREVMLDAEHFYDGYKADPAYALACLTAAAQAGASTVVLCDTNGGSLPWEIEAITAAAVAAVAPYGARVGSHMHNDTGLAVANSLAAVRGGARLVQGCVNGYGERTGNADLFAVMAALQLKCGYTCCTPEQLGRITSAAQRVAEVCHQEPPRSMPFVGTAAFAHKGGLHVAAIRRWRDAYNHIEPALVGNAMNIVVSELSGKGNLMERSERAGIGLSSERAASVLATIKAKEQEGFAYETAGASVDMMMIRQDEAYTRPFRVEEYSVIMVNRGGEDEGSVNSHQALVKVTLPAAVASPGAPLSVLTAGEGVGPVDALAGALRAALDAAYPQLRHIALSDYSVRLLDLHGESSTTRVTMSFTDELMGAKWATVGANASILDASFRALVDGLEFAILKCHPVSGCRVDFERTPPPEEAGSAIEAGSLAASMSPS